MLIYPDKYLENVKEITIDFLKENDIKGLILDVDNTLINLNRELLSGVKEWCDTLKKNDIKLYILSNSNKEDKIEKVSKELDIPYINFAKKPLKRNFVKIQKTFEIKDSRQIAVAGDQILTDVIGARRSKMYSILTKPIDKKEMIITRIKRPIENFIIRRYLKKNGGK